jgi:hypothetical protein
MLPPRGRILLALAMAGLCVVSSSCAARQRRAQTDLGIPACPEDASRHLLSSGALQCWFDAPHGRWRTLNHQSHLEALVVEIEARDLRDAVHIAQRVVQDPMARPFSEILVYVARPEGRELHIRRVRWTRGMSFETLEFSSTSGDAPLTVRSSPGSKPNEPRPKP